MSNTEFECFDCLSASGGICENCLKKNELDKLINENIELLLTAQTQHRKDVIIDKIKRLTAERNKIKTDGV